MLAVALAKATQPFCVQPAWIPRTSGSAAVFLTPPWNLFAASFCSPSFVTLLSSQLHCDQRGQTAQRDLQATAGLSVAHVETLENKTVTISIPLGVYSRRRTGEAARELGVTTPTDLQGPPRSRAVHLPKHKAIGMRFSFQALLFPEVVLYSFCWNPRG